VSRTNNFEWNAIIWNVNSFRSVHW